MKTISITAYEAKEKIEKGATAVDVRAPWEFENGHIPGALLLPVDDVRQQAQTALPDKDAEILVYCQSGIRSREAAAELKAMGYRHIYDLGGIMNWPYKIER